jgi:hypothetical protein
MLLPGTAVNVAPPRSAARPPSSASGRHVLVLFAAALPWLELRDLVRAIALRYPAVDPAPHASGLDTTTTERPVAIAS